MQKTKIYNNLRLCTFQIFILSTFTTFIPQDSKPTIAVIGVTNELESEEWRDARVGFGLHNILSQYLMDTDKFILLEEKSEVRDQMSTMREYLWQIGTEDSVANSTRRAIDLGADVVAYAKVIHFGTPQTKISFGPVHRRRQTTEIKIAVTLTDYIRHKTFVGTGKGQSRRKAQSAIFEFRRDVVLFDETSVGKATREAMKKAVEEAVEKYLKWK